MMQARFLAWTAAALLAFGALAAGAKAGEVNTGYSGDVAIDSYDPVAYFTDGKALRGSEAISYGWLGATWYFASDGHRRLFTASPRSYAPQYGGHCAEGVARGMAVVTIDPESWQIIDGKLYLSAVAHFQDRALDVAAADRNWPMVRDQLAK